MDNVESPNDVIDSIKAKDAYEVEEITEEEEKPNLSDKKILKQFEQQTKRMESFWNPLFTLMEDDWDVFELDQWEESGKKARGTRPMFVVDFCQKFIEDMMEGDYENKKGVKFSSRSGNSSDKANALSEGIRYMEDRSGSHFAYINAKEAAVVGGLGYHKIVYGDDDQSDIPILGAKFIEDPMSIMIDENFQELDGSDMLYAYEDQGKEDGKKIGTYWWIEETNQTIIDETEESEIVIDDVTGEEVENITVTKEERKEKKRKVWWAVICNEKIKEKGVFPGSYIPIIPTFGFISRKRGKTKIYGKIRQLKGLQRISNYSVSQGVEDIALTPKSPMQAYEGQLSPNQLAEYERSAIEPVSVLEHKPLVVDGILMPPPSRANTAPNVDWMSSLLPLIQNLSKESAGIYEQGLGAGRYQTSGKAIIEGRETSNSAQQKIDSHQLMSLKHTGRIMLDIMNVIITPYGNFPVMKESGDIKIINIGAPAQSSEIREDQKDDVEYIEDLDPKDLDISVSVGASAATRKKEGLEKIIDLSARMSPTKVDALMPQIVRDLDFPNAQEYADIIDPKSDNPEQLKMELQQAMANSQLMAKQNTELQGVNQKLTMELAENTRALVYKTNAEAQSDRDKIASDQLKTDKNNASKERIKLMEINAKAQSDNKGIAVDQAKEDREDRRTSAEIIADSEKQQKDLALEYQKEQNKQIEKVEVVQPVIQDPMQEQF